MKEDEPNSGEGRRKPGSQKPIAAPCSSTAGVVGTAGAPSRARCTASSRSRRSPARRRRPPPCQAPRSHGGRRNGARTTRPAPRTTSRRRKCSMQRNGSRTARSTRSAGSTSRACRCSARAPFRSAFPAVRPAARSATTSSCINDEFLATEIGQTGTQFDGLGHIGIQMGKDGDKSEMRFYNGFTSAEINDAYGLKKLGTEKLKPLFTRATSHRHRRAQGRDDGRRPGDHRRRYQGGAAEAEHRRERHQGRRRDHVPYRLGIAVDEEQRSLQRRRAGHRPRSRQMGDREGLRLTGAGYLGGRGGAQSRQDARFRGPCRAADEARHPQPREPDLRRPDRRARSTSSSTASRRPPSRAPREATVARSP